MQYERKHRIAGAVILLLGFALVIPMILREPVIPTVSQSSDQEPVATIEQNDSSKGSGALKSDGKNRKESTVVMTTQDPDAGSALRAVNPDRVTATEPESPVEVLIDTQSKPNAEANEIKTEQATESHASGQEWIVRVGTFTKQENVERSVAELLDNGFDPNRTQVNIIAGKATRVWLGPYPDIDAAKKAGRELKKRTGEDGYVTPHES